MVKIRRIQSSSNELVKKIARLNTSRGRKEDQCFICEGVKVIQTAIENGWKIESLLLSCDEYDDVPSGFDCEEAVFLSPSAFKKISVLTNHQGMAAVLELPQEIECNLYERDSFFALVAYGIQDPGNLGALIRVASGAGCDAFIAAGECADVFSPKVIRGSSGQLFTIPVFAETDSSLEQLISKSNCTVFSSTGLGGTDYTKISRAEKSLLLIGSEGSGLPDKWLENGTKVTIPLQNGCESLNAAVAAGILTFHFLKH